MGLILHFAQSPINFTNTVICHQDILPLLSAYSILLYHYVTDVCYYHYCLQYWFVKTINIKLIIYGYLGSKDAGLWILMYSSHEQSAIWRELRIDESISGSSPLVVCSSRFISGHDYFCSKFLHSSLPWMSFSLFLHLQYFSGFRRHCPDQDNPNSWGAYNIHCIVWIELRSVRYTFVKFKMIPNDCMETITLFMINCSRMFDMYSTIHHYIIILIAKFCYKNLWLVIIIYNY